MIKRTVEVTNPAYLHFRQNQMVVEKEGKEVGTVPIEDLGLLILDNPQVTISRSLLSACAANETVVIISDEKHLPGAILMPVSGHTLHSKIIAVQAEADAPVKKRLWQQVVKAKIKGQARVLKTLGKEVGGRAIANYIDKVMSGDTTNIEGQAARAYWPLLFGRDFIRDPNIEGRNALLNYGYSIIRAATARALVGSGLHPSLGIHHHNQYDAFTLADDMMEPFRPLVDLTVARMTKEKGDDIEVIKETKVPLLATLDVMVYIGKRPLPLMVALHYYTASLAKALEGGGEKLDVPEWTADE